jgi:hypothetical protein
MRAVWDDAGACSWIALALPDWTTPGASFLRRKGDSESSRNRLDMLSVICICVWTDKLLSLKDAPKCSSRSMIDCVLLTGLAYLSVCVSIANYLLMNVSCDQAIVVTRLPLLLLLAQEEVMKRLQIFLSSLQV